MNLLQETKYIMDKYDVHPNKRLGQNFLFDENALNQIAENVTKEDTIIEIGPGLGTLTAILAEKAKKVIAIELDPKMYNIIKERFIAYNNIEIINEDVLKVDISKLAPKAKVVANLPYYITTPIIMGLFESHVPLESVTVMVQKEVADRMQAGPGTKDYGALSLAVQYYSEAEIVANVPPNCFMPRPNVGSAVIRLTCHKDCPVKVTDEKWMFRIICASFNERRKTLQNGLGNDASLPVTKEQAKAAIESMGLSATIRGEALSLAQFAELANRLKEA